MKTNKKAIRVAKKKNVLGSGVSRALDILKPAC